MKPPESLETLIDYGIIQEVIRPLMSGKEAQVYVVLAGGVECVAKVYKEANNRTFKHRSDYTEGRRTRNTRDQRAMSKRSQHGRKRDEDAWRSTEVDMIYRLRDAGVRVPEPLNFVEGVLVMELVKDADGHPAPRLGDLTFSAEEAAEIYQQLIREVVRMLCAGVVHGDLSDFNVLMSHDGPVVIDFPQAVDPTLNPNSEKLLLRDVGNLHRFVARFAPDEPLLRYGEEMWSLYKSNRLAPDTKLKGAYRVPGGKADTREVIELIGEANREERLRREGPAGEDDDFDGPARSPVRVESKSPVPFRKVVDFAQEKKPRSAAKNRRSGHSDARPGRRRRAGSEISGPPGGPAADNRPTAAGARLEEGEGRPHRRRRRRNDEDRGSSAPKTPDRVPPGDAASDSGELATPRRRRRSRRARSRGPRSTETKPAAKDSGATRGRSNRGPEEGRSANQDAASPPKKQNQPPRASGKSSAPDERTGSRRPPRGRPRRPRKATTE